MITPKSYTRTLIVILMWITAVSCLNAASNSTDSTPIDVLAQQDVVKSRTFGEIIGELGGVAIDRYFGEKHRLPPRLFQTILRSAGANIGSRVGQIAANRRRIYSSESEYLESEINATQKTINRKEDQIADLKDRRDKVQSEVKELQAEAKRNHDITLEAGKLLDQVNAQIESDKALMTKYSNGVVYLAEAIRASKEANDQSAEVERQRNQLSAKRTSLMHQYEDINHLDESYRASRNQLIRLAKSGNSSSKSPSDSENSNPPSASDILKNFHVPGL